MKKVLYWIVYVLKKGIHKLFVEPGLKQMCGKCGSKKVRIGEGVDFICPQNIYIGDNVQIGPNAKFWTTNAKIIIGDNVLMGPCVHIHTGNHPTNILEKHIIDVSLHEIDEENFGDVIIEEGAWIGDGVIILKGVKIGKGSVIAAGSVVNKSTIPYSVNGGVPIKLLKMRFSSNEIRVHEFMTKQGK